MSRKLVNRISKVKECFIQNSILEYLASSGIISWRQNNGVTIKAYKNKDGVIKERLVKFSRWNYPRDIKYTNVDINGFYKNSFLAIEVKRPGSKLTEAQQNFINLVNDNGGIAFVATSLDDVKKKLNL